jgi:intein-encoded DNA endonuclease-like protein
MNISQKNEAIKIVGILITEISNSIALESLLKKFAHDERIKNSFDETYEAHAFNLVESSLLYTLSMNLIRICDESERDDLNSLRVLFEVMAPLSDAETYFGDGSIQFEKARELYIKLKGSHQIARVKALRHKYIAHNAIKKTKVQMPKYNHIYELLSTCVDIVELLGLSVICENTDYEGEKEIWNKYSSSFFNNLIQGQLSAKNT